MEHLFYVFDTPAEAQFVLNIINANINAIWDTAKQRVTDNKYVISYVSDSSQQWRFAGVPAGQIIEAYQDGWWGSEE